MKNVLKSIVISCITLVLFINIINSELLISSKKLADTQPKVEKPDEGNTGPQTQSVIIVIKYA